MYLHIGSASTCLHRYYPWNLLFQIHDDDVNDGEEVFQIHDDDVNDDEEEGDDNDDDDADDHDVIGEGKF
jgi:hypothetical protein